MQEPHAVLPAILQSWHSRRQRDQSYASGCNVFDADTLSVILQFLMPKDLGRTSTVGKSWASAVSLMKNYTHNQICLILDNTVSMDADNQQLQREFVIHFLEGLCVHAQVIVRLVFPLPGEANILPLPPRELLTHLITVLQPSFYQGPSTPLFQCICDAVTEGFHIILCLTDGQESACTEKGDLLKLQLYGTSLGKLLEHCLYQIKWQAKARLCSFMQALFQVVRTENIFLPAIVGLNMIPEDSKGFVPVYAVQTGDNVRAKVQHIARHTISKEAGGGYRAQPGAILQDHHYSQVQPRYRKFMKHEWLTFPEVKNLQCVKLLISHRKEQWEHGREGHKQWELPPSEERTPGWYFRYDQKMTHLALEELKQTRERAVEAFRFTSKEEKSQLRMEATEWNWIRYSKIRNRKRKRSQDAEPISKMHFWEVIGPRSPATDALLKRIPKGCYPVSICTFFWLLQLDVTQASLHDRFYMEAK